MAHNHPSGDPSPSPVITSYSIHYTKLYEFDNVSTLVILATILIAAFGMPKEIVLYKMVPGSAVGVLFGDLCYTWLALRLARRSGRSDVTAMPLGLDTP